LMFAFSGRCTAVSCDVHANEVSVFFATPRPRLHRSCPAASVQLGPVPSTDNINNAISVRPPNDVVMTCEGRSRSRKRPLGARRWTDLQLICRCCTTYCHSQPFSSSANLVQFSIQPSLVETTHSVFELRGLAERSTAHRHNRDSCKHKTKVKTAGIHVSPTSNAWVS
jgi:hypothetical protein